MPTPRQSQNSLAALLRNGGNLPKVVGNSEPYRQDTNLYLSIATKGSYSVEYLMAKGFDLDSWLQE